MTASENHDKEVLYSARELSHQQLGAAVAAILHRLPAQLIPILRAVYGIDSAALTQTKIIRELGVSAAAVRQAKARAMTMLLHPAQQDLVRSIAEAEPAAPELRVETQHAVEAIRKLTPEFINHLRKNSDDLLAVRWDVFEHLVAELLVSAGFREVSLVGRDPTSSADIFAAWHLGSLGIAVRYFVEVKRWKDRVGVEVVDRVIGAMLAERPRHGWHAALVVSVAGFSDMKKYSHAALKNMGVELKDKRDLMTWLANYEPDQNGLWLPEPRRGMPVC
jgi:hypothetical protein